MQLYCGKYNRDEFFGCQVYIRMTARKLGIETPESFILAMDSDDEEIILLATERYDRNFRTDNRRINGMIAPYRLRQEDFPQAMGIAFSE